MQKKTNPPQTPSNTNSKKGSKVTQRAPLSRNDSKNQTNGSQFKNKDEQIIHLIRQHLHLNGYIRSCEVLKNQKPNMRAKVTSSRQEFDKNTVMQLFDRGSREDFFKQTQKIFSINDQFIRKLEFQLQIYFCIYSIHPNLKKMVQIDRKSLEVFKNFLDNKGGDLAETKQNLTYFALPHMKKPQQNNALAHLFTKQWITKLKLKASEFFSNHLKNSNSNFNSAPKKQSALQELYTASTSQHLSSQQMSNEQSKQNMTQFHNENQKLRQQVHHLKLIIQNIQQRFHIFTESSKQNLIQSNNKWFFFSRDMFRMCRKYMEGKALEKYQKFFGGDFNEHIEANQISLFEKNSFGEDISQNISKNKINKRPQPSYQIDMSKIRNLFLQANQKEKSLEICLILKALKDRFLKLKNPAHRRQIIIEYARNDICGINQQNYIIQKKLLFDSKDRVKEFYLRLMNYLSTDVVGMQYLMKCRKLLENLVGIFSIQGEYSGCRFFVLGILQRMSFLKYPRIILIENNIIPIIFSIFTKEHSELSQTSLKFITALMMNLSLKKQSRKYFQSHKTQLISFFSELISYENDEVRNYINGSIYLLLISTQIKKEAKLQKLDHLIKELLENHNDDMCTQQYNYILDRMEKEDDNDNDDNSEQQEEEGQEEEYEEFQDQDEELSDVSNSSEYLEGEEDIAGGEELLIRNFALVGPDAVRQQLLTKSVLDETSKRMNNMTTSINKSRRVDHIFNQKHNTQLEPELGKLLNRKMGSQK